MVGFGNKVFIYNGLIWTVGQKIEIWYWQGNAIAT